MINLKIKNIFLFIIRLEGVLILALYYLLAKADIVTKLED
jgi:hypothetical protein